MARRLALIPPLKEASISQRFGEDLTCVDVENRAICVTRAAGQACPVGYESLYTSTGREGHDGVDFAVPEGEPVYAAMNGRVVEVSDEPERGIGVGIISRRRFDLDTHPEEAGSFRVKTRYWHLSRVAVELGNDAVRAGDLIGWTGNTGLSSGPHLHFEVKPQRRTILNSLVNAFPANGYKGAIDPEPYFID
jgi:murein DD-endopeptidase MepM/ murein hydrolase activator NlpD